MAVVKQRTRRKSFRNMTVAELAVAAKHHLDSLTEIQKVISELNGVSQELATTLLATKPAAGKGYPAPPNTTYTPAVYAGLQEEFSDLYPQPAAVTAKPGTVVQGIMAAPMDPLEDGDNSDDNPAFAPLDLSEISALLDTASD